MSAEPVAVPARIDVKYRYLRLMREEVRPGDAETLRMLTTEAQKREWSRMSEKEQQAALRGAQLLGEQSMWEFLDEQDYPDAWFLGDRRLTTAEMSDIRAYDFYMACVYGVYFRFLAALPQH